MQRVITAIVLIPLVLLAVFKAPIWLYAVILAILALQCTHEYLDIAAAHNLKPLRMLAYLVVLAIIADYYLSIEVRGSRLTDVSGWQILRQPVYQYEILLVLVSLAPFAMLVAA